jgi:hypothetical protein
MNEIQFVIEPLNPPDQMVTATVLVTDRRTLTTLIKEFENQEAG